MRPVHHNWPYNVRKSKKNDTLCFVFKWLQSFAAAVVVGSGVIVVVVINFLLSQTKSMRNNFKGRKAWLEMEAFKETNKQTNKQTNCKKSFTARSPKVWPPFVNSHSFMQTLANRNSRTVFSWLLSGLDLYERLWIIQKRSHFRTPCCKKFKACDIHSYT